MQRLADLNKELLLILSIIAAAGVVNFFVAGQRLVLTFYNLPTLLAAYYFGRRRAVQTALASVLFVVWMNLMQSCERWAAVRRNRDTAPVYLVRPGPYGAGFC